MLQQPSGTKTKPCGWTAVVSTEAETDDGLQLQHAVSAQRRLSTSTVLFHDNHKNVPLVCACVVPSLLISAGSFYCQASPRFALNNHINLEESLYIPGIHPCTHHGRRRSDIALRILETSSVCPVHICVTFQYLPSISFSFKKKQKHPKLALLPWAWWLGLNSFPALGQKSPQSQWNALLFEEHQVFFF